MLQDGERPQWAAEHERVIEYEQGGVTYHIPPSVKERLDAPLGAVCPVRSPGGTRARVHHRPSRRYYREFPTTGRITGRITGNTRPCGPLPGNSAVIILYGGHQANFSWLRSLRGR